MSNCKENEQREIELNLIEYHMISLIKKFKFMYDKNERDKNDERNQLVNDTYDYIANELTELMEGSYVFVGKNIPLEN